MPLKSGCTVRLIQEPATKNNPLVVMKLAHGVVVAKIRIQISEGAVPVVEKRSATFVTTVISFDIQLTHLAWMKLGFRLPVEN